MQAQPGARLVAVDQARTRLESGEAMFHVVHRDEAPFVVETGDARLVDLGTAFNVIRRARATSVAVSEGIVVYKPVFVGGEQRTIEAGDTIFRNQIFMALPDMTDLIVRAPTPDLKPVKT